MTTIICDQVLLKFNYNLIQMATICAQSVVERKFLPKIYARAPPIQYFMHKNVGANVIVSMLCFALCDSSLINEQSCQQI